MPSGVRVAIGFTSRGAKGKAIGECAVWLYSEDRAQMAGDGGRALCPIAEHGPMQYDALDQGTGDS